MAAVYIRIIMIVFLELNKFVSVLSLCITTVCEQPVALSIIALLSDD